jgi:zinc protease
MSGADGGHDEEAVAVRVRAVPGAPVVALRVWLPGGTRAEAVPGQSLATGRLLAEGTHRRDFRQLAEVAEALGVDLDTTGSFEYHEVSVDALADDWEEACELLAELVLEPAFPADRARWVTRQLATELKSLGDQPEIRTAWAFLEQLYAPHPRSRPIQGTEEGLASLTAHECAEFHRTALSRRPIITAAGALDEAAVEARLRGLFGGMGGAAGTVPAPPPPGGVGPERRTIPLPGADQAYLFLGHRTIPRAHPDYEALELVGVALGAGAGLTGRIPERIREREGLAYSARGQAVAGCGLDCGRLVVFVGTSPETVERAERAVREELARLAAEGLDREELEACRSYLLGREPFERETARQWAELLAEAVHYGLPFDRPEVREERLRALSLDDVNGALARHLHLDRLRVTVGFPE